MIFRAFVSAIIVGAFSLIIVPSASAHARQPRLEISVERVNPGGIVDVRGVEFDYEQLVKLYLERPGILVQLGEVNADLEGVFLHILVLPVDIPDGVYNIRAVTDHHDILSPALTVQGQPVSSEGGGQGERDDDDGLLAPMPTYAPGVVPGGVPQSASQPTPQTAPVSRRNSTAFIISALLILIGLVVLGSLIMKNR